MTYDQIQKYKESLKRKDRIIMDWMILLAIFFHIVILYMIFPEFKSHRNWEKRETNFMQMNRYKPPPPPKEEKPKEKKVIKKKKVLAKPIPEKKTDEPEIIDTEDDDTEIVYDADLLDIPEPEPPPDKPLRVGGDVKKPELIKKVSPIYPEASRRAHIEGTVILEAIITKEGDVANVKVIKSLNSFCDQAAVNAVKQWKFKPGTQNDIPVDVIMTLTVIFQLH